jgi:filamentous hemagglutinin family protein
MAGRRVAVKTRLRPEAAKIVGQVRRNRRALLLTTALQTTAMLVLALPVMAQPAPNARPQGGAVVAGTATITQTATQTTIDQSTQRAAVNWQSFDVGGQQTVQFQQPNASSITLNRVTNGVASQIAGHVEANGQVVLVNQSGVVFTKGAVVDAQSVVVSAANISNRNFMAGQMAFNQPGNPNARIVNHGAITVKQSGLAALVAPVVANSGVISAKLGRVVLAGATTQTLDLYGDGLLSIDVTGAVKQAPKGRDGKPVTALVTNSGVIVADGGAVLLTARAADGILETLVDAGGRIQANSVGGKTGAIDLQVLGGSLRVDGAVLAQGRAAGAQGGQIEANATNTVTIAAGGRVSASGRAGGGTVAIGTTLARVKGGSATLTAANTTIEAGAKVSANATGRGNGGRVTVLSTQSTSDAGAITARGGKRGGDGGAVEVSGAKNYALTGVIDVGAPAGNAGNILLDPTDLTVIHGAAGSGDQDGSVTTSSAGSSLGYGVADQANNQISDGTINSFTGNVTLQATQNLTVSAGVAVNLTVAPGLQNLVLQAGNDLTVVSTASLVASGNIVLAASSGQIPSSGTGATSTGVLNVAGALTSTGGGIFLSSDGSGASAGVTVSGTLSAPTGTTGVISVSGNTLTLGAGASLTAGARVDLATAGGTALSVNGAGSNLTIDPAATLSAPLVRLGQAALTGDGITIADGAAASSITFAGATSFPSAATLELETTGAVSQSAALTNVGTLTGSAGSVALTSGNMIAALGPFTTTGGFALTDARALEVTGAVQAGVGTPSSGSPTLALESAGLLTLDSTASLTGGVVQLDATASGDVVADGTVSAFTLTGSAAGAGSFSNASNAVQNLGAFTTGSGFSLTSGGTVNVSGAVQAGAGATLALTANGLTMAAGGSLGFASASAADLITVAADSVQLGGNPVNASALGVVAIAPRTAGTAMTIGSGGIASADLENITASLLRLGSLDGTSITAQSLTIDAGFDAATVPNLALYAIGAVNQTGGALTGIASVTGQAGSFTLAQSGNAISTLGRVTATAGDVSVASGAGLTVAGAVVGANIRIQAGGTGLTLGSATVAGTLTATTGGVVSITADTLAQGAAGGAVSASGGTIEIAPNTATDMVIGGPGSTITLPASVIASTLRLGEANGVTTARNIVIGAPTTIASAQLDLEATGDISQAAGATLTAGALSGNANSLALGATGNLIATLTSFATTAGLTLTDGRALTVSGAVQVGGATPTQGGPTLALTAAGTLTLTGSLTGGTVSLTTTTGDVAAAGGALTANLLTGSASGAATLTDAANLVANLGSFTTGGGFSLTNNQALEVSGAVRAGPAAPVAGGSTLALSTAGAITLDSAATLTAGVVSLTTIAGGDVTGNGAIDTRALTGAAAGAVALDNSGNTIHAMNAFTAGGNLSVVDTGTLAVDGAVQAGAGTTLLLTADRLTIAAAGSLGFADASAANQINLVADAAGFSGAIDASSLGTVAISPRNDTTLSLGGAGLSLSAASLAKIDAGTLVLGSVDGGLTRVATLDLRAPFNLATTGAGTLMLFADTVTQEGALANVGVLTGAAGTATLGAAGNAIAKLGNFTGTIGFTLTDGTALDVTGAVATGPSSPSTPNPALALIVAGTLQIDTLASLSAATVSLTTTAGGNLFGAGTVTANRLTGSVAGSATLGSAAAPDTVSNLGAFTTGSDFALVDGAPLVVTGPLTAPGALTLKMVDSGPVANDLTLAGAITAGSVTMTANDGIIQTGGVVSASAGLSLTAGTGIIQTGGTLAESGTAGLTLTAQAGGITQSAMITDTGTGAVTLAATGDIALDGTVAAPGAQVTLQTPGVVSQGGGSLAAGSLDGGGQAATLVSLIQPGNAITALGAFTAARGFTLNDGTALEVTSPVATGPMTGATPNPTLTLNVAGNLRLDSAASLSANMVSLTTTAGGNVSGVGAAVAGGITAAVLTGSIAGAATLTAPSNSVAVLQDFTAGGALTFAEAGALTLAGAVSAGTALSVQDAGDLQVTGRVSAGGSVSLAAADPAAAGVADTLTLQPTAQVSAAAVTLTASGDVTETGNPTLQTAELRVNAGSAGSGDAVLASTGNQLTGLGASTVAGDLILVNAGAGLLTVNGAVQAGAGRSVLLTTDQLAVTGSIATPGGTVAITPFTPARAISVDATRGTATLSLLPSDLANIDTDVGATLAGTIVLGSINGGAARAAEIGINAPLVLTASTLTLDLFSEGDVIAAGTGGLAVSRLSAAAGVAGAGGTDAVSGRLLLGTANAVDVIVSLTATGATPGGDPAAIVFGDERDLAITGPVSAGLLAADGHSGFDGRVSLSSTGSITLSGDVTALARETSGTVATSLTGIIIGAGATLTQSGGAISTDANLVLTSGAGLTQSAGVLTAGGALAVTAGGALTQTGGTISALGNVALQGASVTQSSGLVGSDGGALTVTANGGDFLQSGGVLAASGASVVITATGDATQTGGAVHGDAIAVSAGGTVSMTTLDGRPAFVVPGGTPVYWPGVITLAPGAPPAASTLALQGAAVEVTSLLSASTSIELTATGTAVTESGAGALSTPTLSGSAVTAATLNGSNGVSDLASFTVSGRGGTPGALSLSDGADLTITGPIAVPGGAVTVNETGALTLAGTLTAGTESLTASGAIQQTAATVSATAGDLTLTGASIDQTAGTLSDTGGVMSSLVLIAANGITLGAGVADAAGRVSLQTPGAIIQTGGALSAGTLDSGGVAAASASLARQANQVGVLASFATAGSFTLIDAGSLTVTGPVTAGSALGIIAASLDLQGTVSGGTVSLDGTGGVTQTAGSVSAESSLVVASGAAFTQDAAGTMTGGTVGITAADAITTAGQVVATASAATVTATAGPITQTAGSVSAESSLVVTSGAAFTQDAGGLMTGGTVGITAPDAITTAGQVTATAGAATLTAVAGPIAQTGGTISATGDIVLTAGIAASPSISLAGGVSTAAGSLRLLTPGAIVQSGGSITAGILTTSNGAGVVEQAASATLTQPGNLIATLGDVSIAGDFALTDGTATTLTGMQTAGGFAAIATEAGGITQANGVLTAANVSLVAGIGAAPGNAGITLAGLITTTGTLRLDAVGAITQTGGGIAAATLTDLPSFTEPTGSQAVLLTPVGPVNLAAPGVTGNHIATLAGFTADGFALQDSQTLAVTGLVDARPGALSLAVVSGDLDLTGTLTAGVATLTARGAISQSGGSVTSASGPTILTAGGDISQLAGAAITAGTAATLIAGGAISQGGAIDGGTVALTANGGALTSTGTITAASVAGSTIALAAPNGQAVQTGTLTDQDSSARATLSSGDGISLGGVVTLQNGTLVLLTPGIITQPGGRIAVATLSGAANDGAPTQAAAVSLGQAGNSIGTLGTFSSAGTFALTDGASLVQAGPDIAGGALSLAVTGTLTLTGTLTGGSVSGTATGAINQPSGTVIANAGTLTLTAGGDITEAGAIEDTASGSLLQLQAGGMIGLGGAVTDGPGTVQLLAGGAVAQSGGALTAGMLTGNAATASLAQSGNAIGVLEAFTTAGNFTLADAAGLTIAGPVSVGGAATITGGAGVTAAGALTGSSVAINAAGRLEQQSGAIDAAGGPLALTAGRDFVQDSGGAIVGAPGGAVNVTATGQIVLGGTLAGTGVTLVANGPISAPGTITAATLAGSGRSDVQLDNVGNSIGNVAALSAAGVLTLADGRSLTLSGPLSALGALTVSVSGDLAVPGTVSGQSVQMSATGGLSQSSGSMTATAGDVILSAGAGALAQAGGISGADIVLSDGSAAGITLGGTLATPGVLQLLTNGAVTQPGGSLMAGLLTTAGGGTSPSSAALAQQANRIATLGAFATIGSFVLVDGRSLAVTQPVTSGGDVAISVAGDLSLASTLAATNVALTASGNLLQPSGAISAMQSVTLTAQSGSISQSGVISGNGVTLQAGGAGIALNGTVDATGTLQLLTPGSTIQTGGAVLTALLTNQGAGDPAAAAGLSLQQDVNQVQALGPLAVSGALSITTGKNLLVNGPLTAGALTLTTAGNLDLSGDVSVGSVATFRSGGNFAQISGTLDAHAVVETASGATIIAGDIIAPSIISTSGVSVSLSGAITTGGATEPRPKLGETLPPVEPGGQGAYFSVDSVSATPFTQSLPASRVTVQPIAGTGFATLQINLYGPDGVTPGSGTVTFTNLVAPRTNLILNLGAGFATGTIDVNSLLILGNGGGASLVGIVQSFGGSQAAGVSVIAPLAASNYRINSCVVSSVNCVLLPQETVPVTNPVTDLVITMPQQDEDDPDLVVPNVSDRNY